MRYQEGDMGIRRNKISIGPERNVWLTFPPTNNSAIVETYLGTIEYEENVMYRGWNMLRSEEIHQGDFCF